MNRIIRVKSEKGFTTIPNIVFKSGLSLRATGLLTYILHLPDDWVLFKTWLYENLPNDGRDAVKTAWKELEENGFIVKERTGSYGKGKMPETNYLVYDNPIKMGGFQSTIDPPSINRPSINRKRKTSTLLNTNELSTNKQITNELNTVNTDLVPAGTIDPSPTVNLELEEIKKPLTRLSIPEDTAEMKKERERYESEIVPGLRKIDTVTQKMKIAEYIQGKKPTFYEPYKDLWNLSAAGNGLALIKKLSEGRLRKFKTRIKDPDFDFIEVMKGIRKSAMLRGDNQRGWKVDWDFVFENDTNYLKIIEGKYQ